MSAPGTARRLPEIPWNGVLVSATVLAGVVSIIFILDDTKWPDPVWRLRAFQYLLREQDIAGSVLAIAIALAAWVLRKRSPTLDPVGVLGRNPWATAVVTFVGLCAAMLTVAHNHALSGDEHLALFQSRIFAAGHLTGQFPPELVYRLIPTNYIDRWLIASGSGRVASVYWPGFSLMLVPFTLPGVPWACNPLLASLSLVLIAKLASRLTADARAGGWAMLFTLASPGFVGMALSYFSMTAHLFLNLLFGWLLLERSTRRLVAAGLVGSLALVQSNPVPHILFALPWIAWIGRQPGGRRSLLVLGVGYAPLALIVGLGWWLFLRELQGSVPMLLYPPDGQPLHDLANLVWYLSLQFRAVFSFPADETLAKRIGEQVRLWSWAVPGLPLLALAGWWTLGRRVAGLHLFALSLTSTLVGYLFVSFDQGYGWGARYVHSAWGALPLLAAAAMVWAERGTQSHELSNYVVRSAMFSLVFATALRLFQIHLFMQDQLALRPPFETGVRQIVFIAPNFDFYTPDFVQNDPFLRAPVIFMMSRGRNRDYSQVIERHFPSARLTYDGPEGQVWRLP
ncbi:MAG: hypothetical protein E6H63_17215 [Betaproteobacteria bacterium]|nr:MAG: hypothetical protein E6H63_17215 [Betaproteobacteria bacterium]